MDVSSLRSSPRVVAPVALAIFAIAMLLVIATSTGGGTSTSPTKASVQKQRDLGIGNFSSGAAPAAPASRSATYVVRAGDTLSSIAQRTGVSVSHLQQLNPSIDPQALRAGQKLKLK